MSKITHFFTKMTSTATGSTSGSSEISNETVNVETLHNNENAMQNMNKKTNTQVC